MDAAVRALPADAATRGQVVGRARLSTPAYCGGGVWRRALGDQWGGEQAG